MRHLGLFAAAAWIMSSSGTIFAQPAVIPATFTNGSSGTLSYIDGANWSSNPQYPSGEGASAIFNGTVDGSTNPARSIAMNSAVVLGSLTINLDTSNETTPSTLNRDTRFIAGTGGSLTFNASDSGPATLDVGGSGNTRFSLEGGGGVTLTDDLVATVSNMTYTGTTGALNITTAVNGPGGLTKDGPGTMTLGTSAKTYTGATVLNNGRTRLSTAASPTASSSFTINSGGQLTLVSNNGTYGLGAGVLNLNGNGPTTGPTAAFPGAIRNDTNLVATITNNVNLQSTTTIHVQGTTGSTTLSGAISGDGGLIAGANPHDANLGSLILTGTNGYSGGTIARAGNLVAAGASTNAFGTGDVTVESANLVFAGSQAKLTISSGSTNAIDDLATLSLAGGNAPGTADDGFADLGFGVNETVGGLILGGAAQNLAGTYGSSSSGAMFVFDEYFSGSGLITLVPPAGLDGDYNGNGMVDAADYVLWRKSPDDFGGPTGYQTWRESFAESNSGSGSGAVPEPVGGLLVLIALIVPAGRRRSVRT